MALVWKMWHWIGRKLFAIWAVLVLLQCACIWATDANIQLVDSPDWLPAIINAFIYFLIPAMTVAAAAGIVYDTLRRNPTQDWRRTLLNSAQATALFLLIGCQIFLASVWDVATDGLRGILLWMGVSIAAVAGAVVLTWFFPNKRKAITLAFALMVPFSMLFALWLGSHMPGGQWGESPAYITEKRAETIANAIQTYYEHHGSYPPSLNDLFPSYLVYIPRPIMLPGQTWCYEGGQDYYRLGYVYRQNFSTPASVKIHAAFGDPPDPFWPCGVGTTTILKGGEHVLDLHKQIRLAGGHPVFAPDGFFGDLGL